jgi:hypothetical protein
LTSRPPPPRPAECGGRPPDLDQVGRGVVVILTGLTQVHDLPVGERAESGPGTLHVAPGAQAIQTGGHRRRVDVDLVKAPAFGPGERGRAVDDLDLGKGLHHLADRAGMDPHHHRPPMP